MMTHLYCTKLPRKNPVILKSSLFHSSTSDPMDPDFNYGKESKRLDLAALWKPASDAGNLKVMGLDRFDLVSI